MIYPHEFYPTPISLIHKMLNGLKLSEINIILEPSAGKGDIVKAILKKNEAQYRHHHHKLDIDVVEIDANLRHILKGNGCRVIHDDFLTLETFKRYNLIIMNPPFSVGDKHLLKALEMQKNGGKIICLLNAETIRNPHTNTRKDLVRRLEDYNAEIQYINGAFTDAERKTDVEIALIKVDIPRMEKESIIIDGLKKEEVYRQEQGQTNTLTYTDFIEKMVSQYNFEIRAGLSLIREYHAMLPLIKRSFKNGNDGNIITLAVENPGSMTIVNSYVEKVRYKYWEGLFLSDEFSSLLTSSMRESYMESVKELKNYDFSVFNVTTIKEEISRSLIKSVEGTILTLFDDLSHKWHWENGTSKNIHYYNGWKTNKSWKISNRVIVPNMNAWSYNNLRYDYAIKNRLQDIEKVFNYLDGGLTDHIEMEDVLKKAQEEIQTKKIALKYFTVTFFKKGTCHIEFTNHELLKKFNLFGSQRKGWLPPSYGKAKYEDMSAEERSVIDDFEGREEYEKVLRNKDYYLYKSDDLLMIEGLVS